MSDTPRIRLLTDHVANKIAAGEVVERPASVFKELIENAIDAGSTQIEVDISMGGRKLVRVIDNGVGMNRDNALLSIERHATSKIRDVDDIEAIATLGFRGEALAAIAAVSRFTLRTRLRGDLTGTEIQIAGGRLQEVNETGCPEGTDIAVRNLFYNVPARRKFLKTEQTELSHIRQMFVVYALAHPELGLRLVAEERELYNLPACPSLTDRLRDLFPANLLPALRPVNCERFDMRVHGMIGIPQVARRDRRDQYVFINGRPASAPRIGYAIGEAYGNLLPKGRYPVVFLYLELGPELVDVNVHPTKREVRFRQGSQVRDLVILGLREALQGGGVPEAIPNPPVQPGSAAPIPASPPSPASTGADPTASQASGSASLLVPPAPPPLNPPAGVQPGTAPAPPVIREPAVQTDMLVQPATETNEPLGPWRKVRLIGRVGGLFVLLETEDGLVIMDPQAAHERVVYERYMQQVVETGVPSQGLLAPETVELTPQDALRVRRNLSLLTRMGFGVSEFGGDTFLIDALPDFLSELPPGDLLPDVAATLESGGTKGGTETWAEEKVAKAASRASVSARAKLSDAELRQLVDDLGKSAMPYSAPSGRPTIIYLGLNELKRKFGRDPR